MKKRTVIMETRNWYAWVNLMPPKPDDFHVVGEILVANPGIQASLYVKEPPGINPNILLLDLHLSQQSGMWPQVLTWVQARYDKVLAPGSPQYEQVEIFFENESIVQVSVDVVS
ncbi:MAG: hypothetical protein MI685_10700 [Chlorobiales bacterium]|nr:hypothetical protein [Chlorobiales bacterium]